jgi:hypothetical protein
MAFYDNSSCGREALGKRRRRRKEGKEGKDFVT